MDSRLENVKTGNGIAGGWVTALEHYTRLHPWGSFTILTYPCLPLPTPALTLPAHTREHIHCFGFLVQIILFLMMNPLVLITYF